jgi:hypothetical protein
VIQRLFSVDHARLIAQAGIGNTIGGQRAMAFIQIMQLQTSKVDEMRAAGDEWDKATEGKRTVQRSLICEDRDEPGRHFIIVFFDSYEEAMKNSALPETDALAKKTMALSDTPPIFYNLDVIEERE